VPRLESKATDSDAPHGSARLRAGIRAAAPIGVAVFFVGMSFGVTARPVIGALAAVAMSVIVFAGSAQFAAIAVLADGGSPVAALLAGILLNTRFLAMGLAIAPSLSGGRLQRALQGQTVVDASFALASRGEGRFDRHALFGGTVVQYPAWVLGTVAGVVAGDLVHDPAALGLDALFPAFFLVLLVDELRSGSARLAALLGAALALALVPFVPAGIPVLAASAAALIGLRRR
jgi:4-azaleucine resistance transporter AzlC